MTNAKILVIEDEAVVALHISSMLEQWGYEVSATVTSGLAALEEAATLKPDLALIDIRLEGSIDGIATAQQLYDRYQLPVVYLTAHADEPTWQRAIQSDPFGYLLKPFQARELKTAIEIALQRHQTEQHLQTTYHKLQADNTQFETARYHLTDKVRICRDRVQQTLRESGYQEVQLESQLSSLLAKLDETLEVLWVVLSN